MTPSNRILVVEDEKAILEVYKDILTTKPVGQTAIKSSRSQSTFRTIDQNDDQFDITLVPTGEEAVEAVRNSIRDNRPFAMGFFDVLLGKGIDGIETVKQIHELDSNMYAVLVTAYQDRHVDSIRNLFGKEFQDKWDYLNKPFSEGEILQKARNMVSMWNIRKRDLEHRRHLNELKEKLMESEKSLTVAAVARSIGHEFGNILLQIMGRADLSRDGDEKTMRAGLETILIATEHASKVLERFKNMAKPNHSYKKENLDIADPIGEVLLLIDHELKRKKVEVVTNLRDLPKVFVSHSTMVQVFMNLIINAMHAMKEGGKIEIAGAVVKDNLEVTVRDTGPGILPNNIDRIFEAFFTTKGEAGTGLGLSICKEIIEITHGGQISVSNHPSGGAVFKITIPQSEDSNG